jgi:hypothetical protein
MYNPPTSYEGSVATISFKTANPSTSTFATSMFVSPSPINTYGEANGVAAINTFKVAQSTYLIDAANSKVVCEDPTATTTYACSLTYSFVRDFKSDNAPLEPGHVEQFEVYAFYEALSTKDEGRNDIAYLLKLSAFNSLATLCVATAAVSFAFVF